MPDREPDQEPDLALDLVVRARRVVTPAGVVGADVGIRDGVVVAVARELACDRVVELADDEVLLPGLVDSHVHVNEPGRTEWEGFASATRAAAAGGVTTIVDMPLNSIPPTVDVPALEVKRAAALGKCHVDVAFWGGAVPGNLASLRALHEAGVLGFKCFLVDSGVPEFPPLPLVEVERVMRELAAYDALLVVHAEDAELVGEASGRRYADFLGSRPRAAEDRAIGALVGLVRETGCRVHVLHLSSADAVPLLAAARAEGLPITAETCPHYLSFEAERIREGGTEFKCCPPIREGANREALWAALRDGVIDLVVSDHSPSTPDLKRLDTGDFGAAWGGIASLQVGLAAVWTEARDRGFGVGDVARWMSAAPAALAGLPGKGAIEVGRAADLCVFAPDEEWRVEAARLHHRNPVTPYDGRTLTGAVRATWLRGEPIHLDAAPRGRLLTGAPRGR
ncbi:allantoinase AllB [Nocardioides sp. MAHUQ-72]|uniref:allantoinase AllB n=1 Tax=unclassified Nocardioides TaxID=2615069 RepID=UPI003616033C